MGRKDQKKHMGRWDISASIVKDFIMIIPCGLEPDISAIVMHHAGDECPGQLRQCRTGHRQVQAKLDQGMHSQ